MAACRSVLQEYVKDAKLIEEMCNNTTTHKNGIICRKTFSIPDKFDEELEPIYNMDYGPDTTISGKSWLYLEYNDHWILCKTWDRWVYGGYSDGWLERSRVIKTIISNKPYTKYEGQSKKVDSWYKWAWCYNMLDDLELPHDFVDDFLDNLPGTICGSSEYERQISRCEKIGDELFEYVETKKNIPNRLARYSPNAQM